MSTLVPLFPLGTVLVPGLVLPLHVFEARYRRLVADLLAAPEDEQRFGVVAIKAGHEVGTDGVRALHDVGTLADLTEVQALPDGRYDVQTVGSRRFRLLDLDEDSGRPDAAVPYLRGRVELLPEPTDELAPLLVPAVRAAFERYRSRLRGTEATVPGDPLMLSYTVAANMLLDLVDRQRLLEAPDTAARLRLALRLLAREDVLVSVLRAVPATDLVRRPATPN
ncbi:LON peptidase substrate-binding domain-containing protein [Aquipuribacter nitratireducens]|uniref:LON peptidase substrate-binding domain-containing protein n=1 Tax=Aquipuribacter nitratireducens TaxID=650104 RepID=A0ABW0GRE0_9MICO